MKSFTLTILVCPLCPRILRVEYRSFHPRKHLNVLEFTRLPQIRIFQNKIFGFKQTTPPVNRFHGTFGSTTTIYRKTFYRNPTQDLAGSAQDFMLNILTLRSRENNMDGVPHFKQYLNFFQGYLHYKHKGRLEEALWSPSFYRQLPSMQVPSSSGTS